MKAEIDEHGCLLLQAETPLEAFALEAWHRGWMEKRTVMRVDIPKRAGDIIGVEVPPPELSHA